MNNIVSIPTAAFATETTNDRTGATNLGRKECSRGWAIGLALVLVALLAVADCLIGTRFAFALLYLLPVSMVAWYAGRTGGIWMAAASCVACLSVDLAGAQFHPNPVISVLNAAMQLGMYLAAVFLLSRLKSLTADRTKALTAEIAERKQLQREILEISEREQQRIGAELHDVLCNELVGVAMGVELLETRLGEKSLSEAASAGRIAGTVKRVLKEAHDLAVGLSPVDVDSRGLGVALQALAERTGESAGVLCHFHTDAEALTHGDLAATHLYRIAQEAVSNAVKHGKATEVTIDLTRVNEQVVLRVLDNGVGFSESSSKKGLGLRIMRHRAHLIGGTLTVNCPNCRGVTMICTVPVGREES